MIRHLFKMIWNKKKQNALMLVEMLVSFLVVFAVFSLLVYNYQNYRRPVGINYENVWVINYNNSDLDQSLDTVLMVREAIRREVLALPGVQSASFTSNNLPFSMSQNNNGLTHNKKFLGMVNHYTSDDFYDDVLGFPVIEGRWFTKADLSSGKFEPVLINESLKQAAFGSGSALGKTLGDPSPSDRPRRVIGVIGDIKYKGDYQAPEYAMYMRADTGSYRWLSRIMVKVSPDAGADLESKMFKLVANSLKKSNVEIEHLSEKRVSRNSLALVPMIILLIVAGFLIINVALGLFGVLWYNISRRKGEIGLRRAVGASSNAVSKQLVGEAVMLSTLALLIGSFFAVQFPLLKLFDLPADVYGYAWFYAVLFIYLLVLICAFYPGKQAAAIHPAVALHEE
ncbi:MAG: FtsX-like permease family protein [Flavitalea sp.]